ncbi:hypothetical protein Tco_1329621 [Tanacetum coccineum]
MEYESRVNERQIQTTEEKIDSSKALDASLVDTESRWDNINLANTSSRSVNDTHADDANIIPHLCTSSIHIKGRTQSLVAEKTDTSENRASRNFDLMIINDV